MTTENQKTEVLESQEGLPKVDNSRRSFAKKSAAVAPVIMTLANRSAWGGTNVCSESGWNSFHDAGNKIVSHAAIVKNNQWKSYQDWASADDWPGGFKPLSTLVKQIVGGIYPSDNSKALDALTSGGLKAYQIATVLNDKQSVGIPSFLLTAAATEKDFEDFYNACLV